jgi:hypothetical protein
MSELMCQFAFYAFTAIARLPIVSGIKKFSTGFTALLQPFYSPFTALLQPHVAQPEGSLAVGRQIETPLKRVRGE